MTSTQHQFCTAGVTDEDIQLDVLHRYVSAHLTRDESRTEFIGHPERVKRLLTDHCTDLKRDRYHQGAGVPNLTRMLLQG